MPERRYDPEDRLLGEHSHGGEKQGARKPGAWPGVLNIEHRTRNIEHRNWGERICRDGGMIWRTGFLASIRTAEKHKVRENPVHGYEV